MWKSFEIISWASLCKTFIPPKEECTFSGSGEIQRAYDAVIKKLGEKRFSISFRIDKAIKRYWAAASKNFEMDRFHIACYHINHTEKMNLSLI